MAARCSAIIVQETLAPPWLLANFDSNWNLPVNSINDSSLGQSNGVPVDTGSANLYSITLPFGSPSAYQDGMTCCWIPSNTNTGASTLTVSPLGSAAILTPAGNALLGGELTLNRPVTTIYKSAAPTGFRISGPCPAIGSYGSVAVGPTLECAGCTSVVMSFATTVAGLNPVLAHVAQGVPVTIYAGNSSGVSATIGFFVTDPAGAAYASLLAVPAGGIGSAVNLKAGATGLVLPNASARILTGQAIGPQGTQQLLFT